MIVQTKSVLEMSLSIEKSAWLDEFLSSAAAQGCAPATIVALRQDLKTFAAWYAQTNAQPFAPELVTGVDLRLYRSQLIESGVAAATWNRKRASLRKFCSWAQQAGCVAYDPFQGVEAQPLVEPPPRWLSEAEYHKLARQVEQNANTAATGHAR